MPKLTASRHKRIRVLPAIASSIETSSRWVAAIDQIVDNERLGGSRRSYLPGHEDPDCKEKRHEARNVPSTEVGGAGGRAFKCSRQIVESKKR